jgi:hypothetical protein
MPASIPASTMVAQPIRSRVAVATLAPDAARAYRTWEAHLSTRLGKISAAAGQPSPHWVSSEQKKWPMYNLAEFYLRDDLVPEILSITRVGDAFRIRTALRLTAPPPPTWWSDITLTVYAVREGDAWKIANALLPNTRAWRRDTVGAITYVHARDYPFDRARAKRAVAFTDSLARAFAVPPLAPIDYYLLPDIDAVYRILGLESRIKFGAAGGLAQPVNRQLFSGIPALGEEYRHELAHLVLAPAMTPNTWYLVSEGVATWVGGTSGADFPTAARALAVTLTERPTLSLDSVLTRSYPNPITYSAGAVLVQLVFEHGGTPAVKALLDAGPGYAQMKQGLVRILQRPWAEVMRDWRQRALRYGVTARKQVEPGRSPRLR